MADAILDAVSPLGSYSQEYEGAAIAVVEGYSIVSIALPLGEEKPVGKIISTALKINIPGAGQFATASSRSSFSKGILVAMQPSQMFFMWEYDDGDALEVVSNKLEGRGYLTDQSDSWVIVRVSGERARDALERICPIDLHPGKFVPGSVARTKMEYSGIVVMCMENETYWLMSARSSFGSFLHAIETSVKNIT